MKNDIMIKSIDVIEWAYCDGCKTFIEADFEEELIIRTEHSVSCRRCGLINPIRHVKSTVLSMHKMAVDYYSKKYNE